MTRPRIAESFYDESLAFAPTEAQWRDIEQAYGRELGSELRARIERAATTYLQFASAERGAVCKADVKRYIQRTARQLDPLIGLLGNAAAARQPGSFRACSARWVPFAFQKRSSISPRHGNRLTRAETDVR